MIKVLTRGKEGYTIAVDYCFFLVNKKTKTVTMRPRLISRLGDGKAYDEFGNFTNEYSNKELEEVQNKALKQRKWYTKQFIKYGVSENKIESYIKEKYEQELANFNEFIGKKIYSNVNLIPNWYQKNEDLEDLTNYIL